MGCKRNDPTFAVFCYSVTLYLFYLASAYLLLALIFDARTIQHGRVNTSQIIWPNS